MPVERWTDDKLDQLAITTQFLTTAQLELARTMDRLAQRTDEIE